MLDNGIASSRAELAERENITRARVTQLMKLLQLAPEIEEAFRSPAFDGPPIGEHAVRPLLDLLTADQVLLARRKWPWLLRAVQRRTA